MRFTWFWAGTSENSMPFKSWDYIIMMTLLWAVLCYLIALSKFIGLFRIVRDDSQGLYESMQWCNPVLSSNRFKKMTKIFMIPSGVIVIVWHVKCSVIMSIFFPFSNTSAACLKFYYSISIAFVNLGFCISHFNRRRRRRRINKSNGKIHAERSSHRARCKRRGHNERTIARRSNWDQWKTYSIPISTRALVRDSKASAQLTNGEIWRLEESKEHLQSLSSFKDNDQGKKKLLSSRVEDRPKSNEER